MKGIFKFFTEGGDAPLYVKWFVSSFPLKHFGELDKMIYLFLDYASKLGIPATLKYLQAFLKTDAKRLMREHNIKTNEMGVADFNDPSQLEEAFRVMAVVLQQYYEELVRVDDFEPILGNFKVAIKEFMFNKKKDLGTKLIMSAYADIANEEVNDVFDRMSYDIEEITEVYNDDKLADLDFLLNRRQGDEDGSGSMIKICTSGLPCFDGDLGGLFESMIITYTALAGSGKTRLATHYFAYIPAVLYGVDVRIDSLELSVRQIENMLIAVHIVNVWGGKIKIPDSMMNKNALDDEALKYYKAAKQDLFNNPKYGKIFINDKPLVVERFYRESRQFLSFNKGVKMWIVDYAGMALSSPRNKYENRLFSKADIIDKLYTDIRRLSNLSGCSFFVLNQYNQEGAAKAKAGKEIDQGDIQGGQTVQKFSDYNMYATQTPEQKAACILDISADKVRAAKGFSHVYFRTDLSVSKFEQMKTKGALV